MLALKRPSGRTLRADSSPSLGNFYGVSVSNLDRLGKERLSDLAKIDLLFASAQFDQFRAVSSVWWPPWVSNVVASNGPSSGDELRGVPKAFKFAPNPVDVPTTC